MAGKPGKSGGSRPGSGRKAQWFRATHGESLIMERETIGLEIHKPVWWRVLSISENEIKFQHNNDIIVIRRPDKCEN